MTNDTKNIYCISNIGTTTHFGHFFAAVLIPLLYYDIKTKSKYNYVMKINVGGMFKILKQLFGDRVSHDYIEKDYDLINDISAYYPTFINLLHNKNNNENNILLQSYDIFDNLNYIVNDFNMKEYNLLRSAYIYYNYHKTKQYPNNFQKIKQFFLKNKERYKQLYFTKVDMELKTILPIIISYFDKKTKNINIKKYEIIL